MVARRKSTVGIVGMGILFSIFPDGRFVPRWTLGASAVLAGLAGTGALLPDTWLDIQTWPPPLSLSVASVIFLAQVYRYRRVSNPSQRQQTRAVVFGLMLALVVDYGLPVASENSGPGCVSPTFSRKLSLMGRLYWRELFASARDSSW